MQYHGYIPSVLQHKNHQFDTLNYSVFFLFFIGGISQNTVPYGGVLFEKNGVGNENVLIAGRFSNKSFEKLPPAL